MWLRACFWKIWKNAWKVNPSVICLDLWVNHLAYGTQENREKCLVTHIYSIYNNIKQKYNKSSQLRHQWHGSRDVSRSLGRPTSSVQTKISQRLWWWLPQTLAVPRGWILMTLVIPFPPAPFSINATGRLKLYRVKSIFIYNMNWHQILVEF